MKFKWFQYLKKVELDIPVKIVLSVIGIGFALACIGFFAKFPSGISDSGSFGSLLSGTLGASGSIGALILVYFTYKAQKEELDATKQQMTTQNAMLAQQKFETTFFSLIDCKMKCAR